MVTSKQISSIWKTNKSPDIMTNILNKFCTKYDVTTVNRIAGFLSQVGHESNDCTVLKENLNYSTDGLRKVFPKYFPNDIIANEYARKPEKIANRVYANRMGNGSEASGDGWKFRGKGPIQITGHDNVFLFARYISKSLEDTITYLETVEGSVESAFWYWKTNNLNSYADKDDCDGMSDVINRGRKTVAVGDSIGYADRLARYNNAKKVLA